MKNEALAYAELGWPVFRVRPNSKKPYDRWRNGPTYATTIREEISDRWNEMPDANIGIETGRAIGADTPNLYLAVLDVDMYEGFGGELLELAFDTYHVKTPSGGSHFYFYTERPVKNSVSAMGDGIDVRGAGGMVLAPPSVGATGETYELVDDYPVKRVRASQLEPASQVPGPGTDIYNKAIFAREGSRHEGGRNNYIFKACCSWLHDWDGCTDIMDGLDEYAQRVNLQDCTPPLSGYEVSRTAISAYQTHLRGLRNGR